MLMLIRIKTDTIEFYNKLKMKFTTGLFAR